MSYLAQIKKAQAERIIMALESYAANNSQIAKLGIVDDVPYTSWERKRAFYSNVRIVNKMFDVAIAYPNDYLDMSFVSQVQAVCMAYLGMDASEFNQEYRIGALV